MNVVVRADSGVNIGTGHVVRCVTLCSALPISRENVHFICREQPGSLETWIERQGFCVHRLPASLGEFSDPEGTEHSRWLGVPQRIDAQHTLDIIASMPFTTVDWLIVDHYGISAVWHEIVGPQSNRILVIDDLADRHYFADILLDQNLGRTVEDYTGLTQACVLAGLDYSLLRPEFRNAKNQAKERQQLNNIVITLGGADVQNVTQKILERLLTLDGVVAQISVILGASNPHFTSVIATASRFVKTKVKVQQGINTMAEEFLQADLAIGAAGGTSWERCALGLPTIVVKLAANQGLAAGALSATGAAVQLDCAEIEQSLPQVLKQFLTSPDKLRRMSNKAFALVDAKGVERVIESMMSLSVN
ncbi:UDP-2,4-diacetamido-2,4,6-trideoxy-beta-L-altropyranose hydrolase [Aliidiomarina celeris]|uniref:UDP-2,4-diacetamido-2,4, 6-trideoxy-beta-L-altropyranose hydrolase n=1 Tax=Aliidiomarina celeris TaxID=2249428 RepID=UPI000DE9DAEE|nr:UDP-2,4-diacetamido-2,4,6-trideoxy-beta-L-altropyranose hydrolase [Aliidiomarina celeris]